MVSSTAKYKHGANGFVGAYNSAKRNFGKPPLTPLQRMYRKMASLKYLFIVITLWCIGLDVKLIIYRPTVAERNHRRPIAIVDKSFKIRSEVNYQVVKERNKLRIEALGRSCKLLGYSNKFPDDSLSFSVISNLRAHITPDLNVLFCRVNKCGTTLALEIMKRVFRCDTDCLVDTAMNVKSNTHLAWQVLKSALSFVIVREPYGRLFSSYGNLFYLPKEDWLTRAIKIIKQVRENPTKESLTYGHDLTFAEMIKYIVINFERGTYIDAHVRPMHHFSCNPCTYRFDYLAKLETLTSDLEYLLQQWHRKHLIEEYSPNIIADVKEWTVWGPIKHSLNTVNLTSNSSIPLYNMFLRTWTYYQMKGLVSKKIDMPFRKAELRYIDFSIFQRILRNAMKMSEVEKESVQNQRMEALKQAYATVPMEYMERLSRVVRTDCILFGYDEKPAFLFNRSSDTANTSDFNYLKAL